MRPRSSLSVDRRSPSSPRSTVPRELFGRQEQEFRHPTAAGPTHSPCERSEAARAALHQVWSQRNPCDIEVAKAPIGTHVSRRFMSVPGVNEPDIATPRNPAKIQVLTSY